MSPLPAFLHPTFTHNIIVSFGVSELHIIQQRHWPSMLSYNYCYNPLIYDHKTSPMNTVLRLRGNRQVCGLVNRGGWTLSKRGRVPGGGGGDATTTSQVAGLSTCLVRVTPHTDCNDPALDPVPGVGVVYPLSPPTLRTVE